ncbi:MAG: hydrogenase nickel incorporation protein HypB [Negativicutes bacterium]
MEVKVMKDILGQNDAIAAALREQLAEQGVFVLNLLGSPGSGKTTLLEKTIAALNQKLRLAVIEGDLFTSKDADRIARHDVPVIQINTSGGCHLDAPMIEKALKELNTDALDLLIIENVGNLVCPAEFALGEDMKAVVLSVTEGNDKPLKYPLIFKESALTLLNKMDLVPYTDFNVAAATEDITTIHPGAAVLPVSARTGEGLAAWLDWLCARVQEKREATR